MKDIEAIIPQANVHPAIKQLHGLGVRKVIVESVKVFRSDVHRTMIHRGCTYEQDFTLESELRFDVSEQDIAQVETILAHAAQV